MACSSGGDMNNEEVVVGQWLDPSQQSKSEHNSNLMLFAVEYVHGQDGVVTEQLLSTRNYPTYSHGESQQFVDISESDFHGAPPTTDHMDSAPPPRTIPSSHIEEGENFYPHSSSHAISPPPLQYTQSTSDGLSQTFSSSDSFLQLSSEQCAEMLKSGVAVKLELVLPNGSLAYGVMEPVTKSINVQIPNEFLHTLRSQHAQVAVDITPSTEPDNTEGRRFDFQLQLTHDPTEVRRFDSLQDSNSGKRFEPHVRGTQEESRFETGHEGRRYEAHHTDPPHARRFDHLTEVVSSRIESHFRGEFESRRLDMSDSRSGEFQSHARVFDSEPYNTHTPLSDRNYETHPDADRNLKTHTQLSRNLETHTQLSGNIEMHSQLSRNVESHSQQGRNVETHSQLSRNVEAHPQLSRSFEDHSQPDRNFDTPPQTDTRTFETLTAVRNFDTNDGRDRTSQPLDCSTSLNAIDHRLEEIRIIQESLEGDSLEPSLLEEGLLSRLDAECLLSICDKPVPSRAKATLPASFLYFATVPGCAASHTQVLSVWSGRGHPNRGRHIILRARSEAGIPQHRRTIPSNRGRTGEIPTARRLRPG
ncbi:hypothetical protein M8J76_011068 [Diaphorina citri]|nr:hypothetical protein M8J76_011068 [Diaphorina citri]